MQKNVLILIVLVSILPLEAFSQIMDNERNSIYMDDSYLEKDKLDIQVKGFLDTYHAVRIKEKMDWMSSRTRMRGELSLKKGNAGLFVSLNAVYNGILKERTGINLREAFLTYHIGNIDFKAGKQIIIWGNADALRITDQISPMDYTEFLAQDYDDIRTPVNAFRIKYIHSSCVLEAICIPIARFFLVSTDSCNPWAIHLPLNRPHHFELNKNKPEKKLSNVEYGGRISFNLSGVDFSFCGLQTWNKMPAFSYSSSNGDTLSIVGNYKRMTMLGSDLSLATGNFVIRAEAAAFLNEAQNARYGYKVKGKNSFNGLIGIDWQPGYDWNLSIQYAHKYISGNMSGIAALKNAGMATVRIAKDLFRNTLSLSSFAYIDVAYGGIFNRLSAQYSINDQISIVAGMDYFHANKGIFGMYRDNSEIWMKMKYSF